MKESKSARARDEEDKETGPKKDKRDKKGTLTQSLWSLLCVSLHEPVCSSYQPLSVQLCSYSERTAIKVVFTIMVPHPPMRSGGSNSVVYHKTTLHLAGMIHQVVIRNHNVEHISSAEESVVQVTHASRSS